MMLLRLKKELWIFPFSYILCRFLSLRVLVYLLIAVEVFRGKSKIDSIFFRRFRLTVVQHLFLWMRGRWSFTSQPFRSRLSELLQRILWKVVSMIRSPISTKGATGSERIAWIDGAKKKIEEWGGRLGYIPLGCFWIYSEMWGLGGGVWVHYSSNKLISLQSLFPLSSVLASVILWKCFSWNHSHWERSFLESWEISSLHTTNRLSG